jgi:hypothetical protein
MNRCIIVNQPDDDKLGSSIFKLLGVLGQLDKVQFGDSITIDITRIRFATPFLFLPLSSLIAKLRSSGHEVTIQGGSSYLDTILFPDGFNAIGRDDWTDSLNHFRDRTYLPICQIPSSAGDTLIRERLLTIFEEILRHQLNIERLNSWNGTMLALRIPRDIPTNFDYTRYLE